MAQLTEGMRGPRLEFVVRPAKNKVMRAKVSFDPTSRKNVERVVEIDEKAFIVYMPNGHSYRLTASELARRKLDRQPSIISFETVNDTTSPAGRYKFALNDEQRQKAWRDLENQVIRSCQRRHGPVENKEEVHAESA